MCVKITAENKHIMANLHLKQISTMHTRKSKTKQYLNNIQCTQSQHHRTSFCTLTDDLNLTANHMSS